MSFSDKAATGTPRKGAPAQCVLVREAGVPFQPPRAEDSGVDPFTQWLDLMEVVQMLCPEWPVRDQPMQGQQWKL
ncbi:MAG: hypothetical protein ACT4NV_06135 [Rhodoferax sp.]